MALLDTNVATLADLGKRLDPNGQIGAVIELLSETNEVLTDMLWMEGNLPTGHKTTIRTGLPSVAWRLLNYGVPQSKSKTQQITDSCGMLEAYAEVDKALADLNGNGAAFRASEDAAFLQAMNQEMASTLFYGDTGKTPERFLGFAPRYSTLSATKAATAANILDAGGTGSALTSLWLVGWGSQTVHGIYPKGSKAGFTRNDLGEQTLQDASSGMYQGYRTHYKWDCGLTVRDWRYVVRIANIDLAAIADDAFLKLMGHAVGSLPDSALGRPVFYMNRKAVMRYLDARGWASPVRSDKNDIAVKPQTAFWDIPVRRCDAILNTEARVVA